MGRPSSEIIFLSLVFLSIVLEIAIPMKEWIGREKAQKTQKHVEGGTKGESWCEENKSDRGFERRIEFFATPALFRGHQALRLLAFRENQV